MRPARGLHHVAFTVSDLDASIAWYRAVLGLEEVLREQSDPRRAVVLTFPGTQMAVGLVQHAGAGTGERFDATRTGLDHVAFSVAGREELDEWVRALDEHGIDHSGVIEVAVGAILNFKDPDGIALAFFWDS